MQIAFHKVSVIEKQHYPVIIKPVSKNIDENNQFLTEILCLVAKLRKEYGFESLNMAEASALVLKLNNK